MQRIRLALGVRKLQHLADAVDQEAERFAPRFDSDRHHRRVRFARRHAEAGAQIDQGDDPSAGSTDMANVSWICPTIHPDLAIAPEGTPGHSILFRDAAATPRADETTLLAATLVAQTAADLFLDPVLVEAAWRAFREA